MTDLYIYYRVREELADRFAPRVQAMQLDLAARTGIQGKLKRRLHASDGLQTWMEVYLATGPGFDALLFDAVETAMLSASIDGERHTEAFMDISPCA
jgi:hypothetical protein